MDLEPIIESLDVGARNCDAYNTDLVNGRLTVYAGQWVVYADGVFKGVSDDARFLQERARLHFERPLVLFVPEGYAQKYEVALPHSED